MKIIKLSFVLLLFFGIAYGFTYKAQPKLFSRKQDSGMTVEQFLKKTDNKEKIVLVYFNADWCMPCVKLKPIMEQIEAEEKAGVEVLRIDVDKNPLVALHFEINSLPLFMIYKNGKKVWENNMFMQKSDLVQKLHVYMEDKK